MCGQFKLRCLLLSACLMMALVTVTVNANASQTLIMTTTLSSSTLREQNQDKQYQQALKDARAGQLEPSISVLGSLVAALPQRQDILRDYAVVLGWAGKYEQALALYDRIDIPSSPAYVIEGLASSARHQQRFEFAESLYRQSMARFPERIEPQIGLAYTLADQGVLPDKTKLPEQPKLADQAKLVNAWHIVQQLREKY